MRRLLPQRGSRHYGRRPVAAAVFFCQIRLNIYTVNTMSTVLFLKSSLCRLPPSAVRKVAGCSYYTKKGVYGYRPKETDREHKLQSDRIASLNQGQCAVNFLHSWRVSNIYSVILFDCHPDSGLLLFLCVQIMFWPVWWKHTEHMDTKQLKLIPCWLKSLLLTVSQR